MQGVNPRGSHNSQLAFGKADNINGGDKDSYVSYGDVNKAYQKASGDEKKHLKQVLDGFDNRIKQTKNEEKNNPRGLERANKGLLDEQEFSQLFDKNA